MEAFLQSERESLGKFPRDSDGSIAWTDVDKRFILASGSMDDVEPRAIVRQYVPTGYLTFLWGSLAIPAVAMKAEIAADCIPGIVEAMPEFLIYNAESRLVVDFSFFGLLTVANVPGE
ncbi:hypothetical protein [Streptomyces sp. TLI_146]|uniref:hypothetical protein n=1 Tax=Streptomyces sp. TLI_146 TaxID=1938858 RepID=UPI0015D5D7D9|nr:hypothetical protein [Streptomyces sp. TLI_146]